MGENLYIHVPFCSSKCDYCAFYSIVTADNMQITQWLDKIIEQLDSAELEKPLETIFIGGGTPTALSEANLECLFKALCRFTGNNTEISIESNPETISSEKIELLAKYITRISMGVQTFNPQLREKLGRRCSDQAINSAIKCIRAVPNLKFNIDLIYAIPGQTLEDWESDLNRVIASGVDHVSCYNLSIEEGTALVARLGENNTIDDELSIKMWNTANKILSAAGMPRYEISNYAADENQCRHNRNIWYGGRYLGLGPAASSFNGRDRWTQVYSLSEWLEGQVAELDIIASEARINEIFSIGLRTVAGWKREQWERVYTLKYCLRSWAELTATINVLPQPVRNLFKVTEDQIKLTKHGLNFWDLVAEALI
ncbi:MAG: radical SAM family heme chaperone HemW [Victivallaceae bacterium]|nr:radical SAM family heme chaperone HemW [Victivallaceae bacterium]MDD4180811.1 radical SAM family heme chaperone HemW [Victivallaceae bacterium]